MAEWRIFRKCGMGYETAAAAADAAGLLGAIAIITAYIALPQYRCGIG